MSRANSKIAGVKPHALTADQRKKLEQILVQENLKTNIVYKYLSKYCSDLLTQKKITRGDLHREIKTFLKTNKDFTNDNLQRLESRIRKSCKKENISNSVDVAYMKTETKKDDFPELLIQAISNNNTTTEKNNKKRNLDLDKLLSPQKIKKTDFEKKDIIEEKEHSLYQVSDEDNDEWNLILKHQALKHKKEQEEQKIKKKIKQELFQNELKKQIEEKNERKKREIDNKDSYVEEIKRKNEIIEIKEKEKEEERKRRMLEIVSNRNDAIKYQNSKRKYDKIEEHKKNLEIIEKAKLEIEEEKKKNLLHKEKEKKYLQDIIIEKDVKEKKAVDMKKNEKEVDKLIYEDYLKQLEIQEERKKKQLEQMDKKVKKLKSLFENNIGKNSRDEKDKENQKIIDYYNERMLKDKLEEDRRKEIELQKKRELREYLSKQVDVRKSEKEKEFELNSKQAEFWKKDTEEYLNSEKKKRFENLEKSKRLKEEQKDQIKELKENKGYEKFMNLDDLLLNKPLLKEMVEKESPNVHKKNVVLPKLNKNINN